MPHSRFVLMLASFMAVLFLNTVPSVQAKDESFYSPVISIDKEAHRVLISTLGAVFWIEVPEAGQPHMDKLPISGLVDFVVEMRGNEQAPLIKSWKVKSGESACMYFNGKECK